ncbi:MULTISPECIES: hypothetical protein [Micrococcaceae]|jgi:hypothetical protein|uniref:hypothetical protein n=1 Tax=Micrococcaceae TaxID=1268 RepID=UPI0020981E7D|nr:hypothetical protein [Arthrobacter sp. H16F315]MDD1478733.1 hypothetical protein [Arthrobacter sp. H16F315]MDD1478781.1 hypothetical protein [Arthrobacter sp. H16F315]
MPTFQITYASNALRERLPETIEADDYHQSGGFFIFVSNDEDPLSLSTVKHRLAAKTVLHIERMG